MAIFRLFWSPYKEELCKMSNYKVKIYAVFSLPNESLLLSNLLIIQFPSVICIPVDTENILHIKVNKRPMGHIAHLRKQFKWLWLYHYVDQEKKNPLSTVWELNGSSFEQTWIPSSKDALCQVWLKLVQWFWKRRFLNSSVYFHYFAIISLGQGWGPSFDKIESPSSNNALCKVRLKLAQWFWRRFFKFHQCIFAIL